MDKKLILVTGGAGYIGSVMVRRLLEAGYAVRILDFGLYGTEGIDAVLDQVELIKGDIKNPPEGIMDGVYGVIHLAAISSQNFSATHSPRYTNHTNHIATELVARLAKDAGVERFVFASSCSVYCSYTTKPVHDIPTYKEDSELAMHGPYAISKVAAEEELHRLTDEKFRPTIFRMGTLSGFSPKMRYDLVLNSFTKDSFKQGQIEVHAGGEIYRPIVDIQDVCWAYIKALELPLEKVGGEIFNLCTKNVNIGELAHEYAQVLKEERGVEIKVNVHPFKPVLNYQADNSKLVETFGFKPQRELKDMILEIWDALQNGHDFENKMYYQDDWHRHLVDNDLLPN